MKVIEAGPYRVLDFPTPTPDWNFWPMWADGRWEPGTHEVIQKYAPGEVCVDIGAWVGPTAIWMAEAGAVHVRAYEPDPVAHGVLHVNVELNGLPVDVCDEAVSDVRYTTILGSHDFGASESSLRGGFTHEIKVPAISVEDACFGAGFVKVDIEGAEHGLLPELAKVGCPMLIAVHQPWWPDEEPDFSGWSKVVRVAMNTAGFGDLLCLP